MVSIVLHTRELEEAQEERRKINAELYCFRAAEVGENDDTRKQERRASTLGEES